MAETTGIEYRWKLFETVPTIVDEKFEDGRTYASDALNLANTVIQDLRNVATTLNSIDTTTSINYIPPPDSGSFTEPVPTSPNTDFNAPTAPSSPDATFNAPTAPSSPDATFNAPTAPSSPNTDFNSPTAPSDTDDLQSVLRGKLLNDISSGTPAISPDVETAIFNRESERAALLHQDTLDNISAEWAKRGFTLSNAILASLLSQAEIDYTNKRLDINRDIAIKNFELSDTNVKFAVQQGISYIGYKVTIYKAEVDAEIGRIDSIIKKYLGNIDLYKTEWNVEMGRIDSIIKKFLGDVDIYRSTGNVEIGRVDSIIKKFLGDIDIYKASGNVEVGRVDSIIKKFLGDVDIYRAEGSNEIGRVDSIVKKFLGDVDSYKAEGNVEIGRVDSIIKKFLGEIDRYKAYFQGFASLAEVNVREFEAELKQEVMKAELLIKNVEIDIKNFEVENNLKIEADKAIGSINSQVVAGALSSVSASVHMEARNASDYSFSSNPSY